jgi:energy-coupling factor transporter ATP-binding protein EcfA2
VIRSIELKRFRGIREGKVENLSPLTVLVGRNACGKSAVLEALYIGSHRAPTMTIAHLVNLRPELPNAVRWLVFRSGDDGDAEIRIDAAHRVHPTRITTLQLRPTSNPSRASLRIGAFVSPTDAPEQRTLDFHQDNTLSFETEPFSDAIPSCDVRLIKAGHTVAQNDIEAVFTKAVQGGYKAALRQLLSKLVPNFEDLEMLAEAGKPVLHVRLSDRATPLSIAGDGIRSLVRQAVEMGALSNGLVLLDEPEAFMHPAAIYEAARVIWAAVRRQVQVVIATHNLELLDALVADAGDDVHALSVYRLHLANDVLRTSRTPGDDVALLRTEMQEDFR